MFRPFRRSGPPPFQVMSSTWRGATRASQKAAAEAAPPVAAEQLEAEPSKPVVESKRIVSPAPTVGVQTMAKPRETEKPSPRATIEVRRRNDPPSSPKQSFDFSRLTQPIAKGAAWLGGATLALGAIAGDGVKSLKQRFVGKTHRGQAGPAALPRKTVVLGFAALAAVIMVIVWIMSDPNTPQVPALQQNQLAVTDTNLKTLEPRGGGNTAGTQLPPSTNRQPQVAPPVDRVTPPVPPAAIEGVPRPKLARTATDPRVKGQRYYTLATYSVNKEAYLVPLLEYLWSQGVEAAAINGHNSGFFQVVALQGFTRDEINSKAHKQYEETLRRIGRKWKAEGGGDDNLQGLYLQEYSGAQAKLSITKAN